MARFPLTLFLILLTTVVGFGQDTELPDSGWKIEKVGRWGIRSIGLPVAVSKESDTTREVTEGNAKGTRDDMGWVIWLQGENVLPTLRVSITVINWESGFPRSTGSNGSSPEAFVRDHHNTYTKFKAEGINGIVQALSLELSGQPGSLYRRDFEFASPGGKQSRTNIVWTTWRKHLQRSQTVILTVAGKQSESDKLLKIINSLSFENL